MKSRKRNKKADNLVFHWDNKAPSQHEIEKITDDKPRSLEEYFKFLEETKPHKQELTEVKVYGEPFTL